MQTFMPYQSFRHTAKILDDKRLGKQRVECLQILNSLEDGGGWDNHPIVKMWCGYEDCLRLYMNTMIEEWVSRGKRNTMELHHVSKRPRRPDWVKCKRLHRSHRSNLIRKDPWWYGHLWPDVPDNLPYVWFA